MNLLKNQDFKDMSRFFDSKTRRFERLLSQHTDNANVLSVCNATIGIMGVFYSLGLTGCEVITTPLTWAGAFSGLRLLNNKLIFAEVEEPTLTISPDSIEKLITPNTKAVFTADFLGHPARLDEIKKICEKRHLIHIHDAASSFKSMYKGKYSGYYADVCVYSFGRSKAFTTGEGGAIICHKDSIYEKLIYNLAHPERQDIQCSFFNQFALNTSMNPFSIEYGLKTFEKQIDKIINHQNKVTKLLKKTNFFDAWPDYIMPNFYKPVINTTLFNAKQQFKWASLPYRPLSICGISCENLKSYQISHEICFI